MNAAHSLLLIAVMAAVTVFLRTLPFVMFTRNTPKTIVYLGSVLPYAVMAMLVVYCLKSVNLLSGNHSLPELIAVAVTALLHHWKHNTLLSIAVGTVCYMLLVQGILL